MCHSNNAMALFMSQFMTQKSSLLVFGQKKQIPLFKRANHSFLKSLKSDEFIRAQTFFPPNWYDSARKSKMSDSLFKKEITHS